MKFKITPMRLIVLIALLALLVIVVVVQMNATMDYLYLQSLGH